MIRVFKKRMVLFAVVIVLLLFLHLIGVLSLLENGIVRAINPTASNVYKGANEIREGYHNTTDKRDLLNEVKTLKQKVDELIVKNSKLQEIEDENIQLRKYLDFSSEGTFSHVLANIISKESFLDSSSKEQNILINKGSVQGVREGLVIVNEEGLLIGKIIDTKDYISRICLITSSNCKFAATIQNKNKTIGISEGDLGLTVKMNFVSQADSVEVGNIIITSGLEKDIARGFVIGEVSQVNNQSNDVWQTITVEPLINFNDLNIVSVIFQ